MDNGVLYGWRPTFVSYGDWLDPSVATVLLGIIWLAIAGTTVLFLLGVAGYYSRRTTRYLVIGVVLGLLVVRSLVGLGTVIGVVPMWTHHFVGHGLDFGIAVLIVALLIQQRRQSDPRI